MSLTRILAEFIDHSLYAKRIHEVGSAFQMLGEEFGYSSAILIDAEKLAVRGEIGDAIHFATEIKGDVRRCDRAHPLLRHARFAWCQGHDAPIFLDDLRQEIGIDEQEWNGTLPFYLLHRSALLLPVYDTGALAWYVRCSGVKPDKSAQIVSLLLMAAHVAHDRVLGMLAAPQDANALSSREALCLRWIGAGKTDAEISTIVGIAARTVRFHIKNAKKKLGVQTRSQAIALHLRS